MKQERCLIQRAKWSAVFVEVNPISLGGVSGIDRNDRSLKSEFFEQKQIVIVGVKGGVAGKSSITKCWVGDTKIQQHSAQASVPRNHRFLYRLSGLLSVFRLGFQDDAYENRCQKAPYA